jgi:hypothetical protein
MEKSSIPQSFARPGVALIAIEVLWFYVPWRGSGGLVVNLLGDFRRDFLDGYHTRWCPPKV